MLLSGMIVSGLISTAIAVVVTWVVSMLMPMPWSLAQTLVCVAIASFSGAAVSFQRGYSSGRAR
jgi:hypothetical protein